MDRPPTPKQPDRPKPKPRTGPHTETQLIHQLFDRLPRVIDRMLQAVDVGITPVTGGGSRSSELTDLTGKLDPDGNTKPDIVRIELRRLGRLAARIRNNPGGHPQAVTDMKAIIDRWDPSATSRAHVGTLTDGPPGCKSCQRVGSWSPIKTDGLCQTCCRLMGRTLAWKPDYDSELPPVRLVDMSRSGVRITDRIMKDVLGA